MDETGRAHGGSPDPGARDDAADGTTPQGRPSRLPPPAAYLAHRDAEHLALYGAASTAPPAPAPATPAAKDGRRSEDGRQPPDAVLEDAAPAGSTPDWWYDADPVTSHDHHRLLQGARYGRRRAGWLAAVVATVLIAALGVGAAGWFRQASTPDDTSARSAAAGSAAPGSAVPGAAVGGQGPTTARAGNEAPAATRAAVAALLSARARAVLAGGVGAIEATGGGAVFDARRLAALPFEGWTYDVAQVTTTADPRRFDVAARLDYRLAGEPAPTGAALQLVVADTARGWRVQEERSTTGSLLWEVGPLTVVTGARTLVIGVGNPAGGAAALRGWAADGAIAVRQIRAAVPDGWPGRLTLVVPGSSADTARLTGRSTESLEGLAAVTLAEAQPTAGSGQRVFRVYLDLPVVAGISGVARQIVLRHEVTHVATGAPATNATPLWLEEGYAQYLGYRGSAVPLRVAVRDLRADRLPSRPPSDDEFTGQRAAAAYEAAHVLCVVMAEQVGEDGLLRVYRRTASGLGFVAAWRSVAHEGQGALFAAWRDRMRAETS